VRAWAVPILLALDGAVEREGVAKIYEQEAEMTFSDFSTL